MPYALSPMKFGERTTFRPFYNLANQFLYLSLQEQSSQLDSKVLVCQFRTRHRMSLKVYVIWNITLTSILKSVVWNAERRKHLIKSPEGTIARAVE